MNTMIARFFSAWQLDDPVERAQVIGEAVADTGTYADPMTPEPITGTAAIAEYVGNFSANAPGWRAWIVDEQTQHGLTRASVAFGDGDQAAQYGQYFVDTDDAGKITRMVGFVGLFNPE